MCHEPDAHPPGLPPGIRRAPIAGGALETHELVLSTADGNRLRAFAARPSVATRRGVLIFPDWRGLSVFYEELALRLAEAGYEAIAFDYFGRTAGTDPHPAEFDQMPHIAAVSPATVALDAAAAAAYLRSPAAGEVGELATIGFCFGGRHSLLQSLPDASTGPHAIVAFYGQLGPDPAGRPGPLAAADGFVRPILGLYGGADGSIPVGQVEELDRTLTRTGLSHELHVYPRATHSFFDRRRSEFAEEAEDAWRRLLDFLGHHVPPASAG
jgi:carboxymethylenebutenolidase